MRDGEDCINCEGKRMVMFSEILLLWEAFGSIDINCGSKPL